jgi:predicted 3-demethylubiquinone-9 3-methyltransferase (glyoxalase superfamily)
MQTVSKVSPCLWFDRQAEEAVNFYTGIFPNSRITEIARFPDYGREFHGGAPGSVMTVAFQLDGRSFIAFNGGPVFRFSESISMTVDCENQEEVDYYWERLGEGGDEAARQCGWLKDKYGLSWQIVPRVLPEMLLDPDAARARRAFAAMMDMRKLDIAALKRAFAGE